MLFSLPKKTAEKKDDRGEDLNPAVNTRQRGTENSREVSQFCEVSKEKNSQEPEKVDDWYRKKVKNAKKLKASPERRRRF